MSQKQVVQKQVILGAQFPGVNNFTVWSDPAAGSQIAFSSFAHFASTVERGKLDFIFLAEGLRVREQKGRFHELDVVGRPNTLAILAAISAITRHVGLIGTLTTTFNEPYALARQLATIDALSGGRSGWNVVTSPGAFTGANFRRGDHLPHAERYERAREFLDAAFTLWKNAGGGFDITSKHVDIHGRFNLPPLPQGRPVIAQAGDSDTGRELAASRADVIYSRHGTLEEGQAFYADVKSRLARYGRSPDSLKILPGAAFVLGDSDEDARERLDAIRLQQVSPKNAITFLEQVWNRDLSAYDPEGPLPDIDPDVSSRPVSQGRANRYDDALATAKRWREIAERDKLSIRQLIIRVTARQHFVGTPETIAREINRYVQADAADGFVFAPHLTPTGFDDFVDRVIPFLQEWGVFRADYGETTLRGNLGLPPA
ncbi:LLM class flavin-dependent oxidoreductase [Pseudochelatococcus sp. B33]